MRTSGAIVLGVCVLGALMGAAAVWRWGREMEEYVEEKTRGVRDGVREVLDAVRPPSQPATSDQVEGRVP